MPTTIDQAPESSVTSESTQGQFGIKHLYVKEQSAKVPHTPGIFQQEGKPETNIELNIQNRPIEKELFEVTLTLTVSIKVNQQTAMNAEVTQAGAFELKEYDEKTIAYLLGAYCPTVLYPYARRVVANLVLDGGFSALNLPVINFEQMYQQREQKAAEQSAKTSTLAAAETDEPVTVQ